jgi:RNA polymerase sigma-70 factor (ECF subfamily)
MKANFRPPSVPAQDPYPRRVGDNLALVAATPVELESALLGRVARGDERALAELYDRLAPFAYGLALRMTGDTALAQDAVQDAFVRVWSHARSFDRKRGNARGWLLRIVRNSTIDALRTVDALHRATLRSSLEPVVSAERPDELIAQRQLSAALRRALEELPDEQRHMLEIAYFEGLSHSEIAARENIPLGTVKTRIREGVLKLRKFASEGTLDV